MFALFEGVTELQCEFCCVYVFAKLQNTIYYYYTLENVGSISKINTGGQTQDVVHSITKDLEYDLLQSI